MDKLHDTTLRARRQRRIERRRQEIMAAAVRLFAEKGYAHTTTKEIAEAADMAEGTLYNYFDGKREILIAVVVETQTAIEVVLSEGGRLRERADIVAVVETLFDLVVSRLAFVRTLLTEAWLDNVILHEFVIERAQELNQRLQSFIVERIEAGAYRPINPALAARMMMGMFAAVVIPVLRGVAPPPTADERRALAEDLVGLILDGVRVRAGCGLKVES